jgi:predicted AAA+ superfamily ATPase
MGPLSCLELDGKMDSLKALSTGCLPEPYFLENPKFAMKLLSSYFGTYLQEEIMNEAVVRQLHGFSRFLTTMAANSGGWLDFSKLAQKSKVDRSAARRYYEILEDTLICDRVDSYDDEGKFDLVRHPKFYLFDVGIVNAALDNFQPSLDRIGPLFEHLFFNQLKNSSYATDRKIEISHFRTRGGVEVDFIVKTQDQLYAIEVKTSEPSPDELRPMKLIDTYFKKGHCKKYVACLRTHPKNVDGISILPWQEVIKAIFADSSL